MSGGFDVELSALREYSGRSGPLADEVRGVATGKLAALKSMPSDMFGDLGTESGLHGHLGDQVGRLHDHVHTTANSIRDLGGAVSDAHGDYEYNEQDHEHQFRHVDPHE